MRKLFDRKSFIESFFTDPEIAIVAVTIDELRMLVDFGRFVNQTPGSGRKVDDIGHLRARITVLLGGRIQT